MRLLFFKAGWCVACHAIEDKVPGYCEHVDCEKDQELATKYNVAGLPVFVAVDNEGNETGRIQTCNMPMLDAWFKALNGEKVE